MKAERKVMVKLMEKKRRDGKREELVEKEVRNSATKKEEEEERTVRRVHATSREQLEFFQLVSCKVPHKCSTSSFHPSTFLLASSFLVVNETVRIRKKHNVFPQRYNKKQKKVFQGANLIAARKKGKENCIKSQTKSWFFLLVTLFQTHSNTFQCIGIERYFQ